MAPSQNRAQKVWAAAVRHAKEHHESVQNAFEAYYGLPIAPAPAAAPKPKRATAAASASSPSSSTRSSLDKAWNGVKKYAHEHHQSVNNAHAALYGSPVCK